MVNIKCLKKNFLEKDGITFDDWIKDERNVYIGKKVPRVKGTFNSKWLNPYELKKYGIEKSLSLYRDHVVGKLFRGEPSILEDLSLLGFNDSMIVELNQMVAYFNLINRSIIGLNIK